MQSIGVFIWFKLEGTAREGENVQWTFEFSLLALRAFAEANVAEHINKSSYPPAPPK